MDKEKRYTYYIDEYDEFDWCVIDNTTDEDYVYLEDITKVLNKQDQQITELETRIAEYQNDGMGDAILNAGKKIKELQQQLEETEELNKKLAEHSQSVDKALDDSCDVIRNLKMQLAEKEEYIKYNIPKLIEANEMMSKQLAEKEKEETKRMQDFEKGCQEYYSSDKYKKDFAIAELEKVKSWADIDYRKHCYINAVELDKYINQQIKELKGK